MEPSPENSRKHSQNLSGNVKAITGNILFDIVSVFQLNYFSIVEEQVQYLTLKIICKIICVCISHTLFNIYLH